MSGTTYKRVTLPLLLRLKQSGMTMLKYKIIKEQKWSGLHQELKSIREDVSDATTFIKEIEKGNLDVSIADSDSSTELIQSLITMRDQMKQISLEEKERSWVNEGLAKFVEILRSKNDNLSELSDNIIRHLVNYVKANQGALYLINDENADDVFIEMLACYAYNRKKHLKKRIALGEGMIGQVVLEKQLLYMTDVPPDFIKITSGLGEALPRNLLVVPLKMEDRVFGVIEMASFQLFKPFEIDFVEKIGESIAATISSVKVSARTATLLQETQLQAEKMRAQEEEMRQNLEELTATQEEMRRVMKEVESKEAYMTSLLNVTSDSIFSVDRNFRLVTCNKAMEKSLAGFGLKSEKGVDTISWYADAEKEQQRKFLTRAFSGESFEFTSPTLQNGVTYHFLTVFAPLRNDKGEINEVAVFSKDITAMVTAKQKAELLMQEAQNQAEELKSQEEELRQNMEELSATQDEMQRIVNEVQARDLFITNVINASKDSILAVDTEFKVINVNTAFRSMYKGVEITKGFDIRKLFPPAEVQQYVETYSRAFAGETFELETHYRFDNIDAHYVASYVPLHNANNEIDAVAVFLKDVTAITLAKKQIEESERTIKGVLDVSGDSIITVDRDHKIMLFNETFRASFAPRGSIFNMDFM